MASNYVDNAEEGRFHSHGYHSSGTTPTGAAASPKMRRSWSSAASASSGSRRGHGSAPKCVCAPATHAGSFKCRLHRSSSQDQGQSSTPPTAAAPAAAVKSSSSRTVAAQ